MLNKIIEAYPDEAIIGLDTDRMVLVYSTQGCIDILVEQGSSLEDATEHFFYDK